MRIQPGSATPPRAVFIDVSSCFPRHCSSRYAVFMPTCPHQQTPNGWHHAEDGRKDKRSARERQGASMHPMVDGRITAIRCRGKLTQRTQRPQSLPMPRIGGRFAAESQSQRSLCPLCDISSGYRHMRPNRSCALANRKPAHAIYKLVRR